MAEQWMTVAEAASVIKVHPRTIERRMVAGKIESRRNDDGQVQVLTPLPDTTEPVQQMPAEAFDTMREMADRQVDLAAGTASALVRVAQEQAMRAENQLTMVMKDARRYRRESQWALAFAACILMVVVVAVGWCTTTVTTARDAAARSGDTAARATEDARRAEATLATERVARTSRRRVGRKPRGSWRRIRRACPRSSRWYTKRRQRNRAWFNG